METPVLDGLSWLALVQFLGYCLDRKSALEYMEKNSIRIEKFND